MYTHSHFILTFFLGALFAASATAETESKHLSAPQQKFFQLRPYIASQPVSKPGVARPLPSRAVNQVLGRKAIENAHPELKPEAKSGLSPLFDERSMSTPIAPLREDVVLSVFDPRPDVGEMTQE